MGTLSIPGTCNESQINSYYCNSTDDDDGDDVIMMRAMLTIADRQVIILSF